MKKPNEQLFESITNIDDDLIEEALQEKTVKKTFNRKPLLAVAACIGIFLIGAAIFQTWNHKSPLVNFVPPKTESYQSYAGPLLPLTMTEHTPEIQAIRNTNLDFSAYDLEETYQYYTNVSDQYKIRNTSDTTKTVEFLYPFTGSYEKLFQLLPTITNNDNLVSTELLAGNYTGSFTSDAGAYNLKYPESWKDYDKLLEDGTYIKHLFSQMPNANIPVTLYQFIEKPVGLSENIDLVVNIEFNPEKTKILSYGFNGGEYHDEENYRIYHASLPEKERLDIPTPRLIVIGDELTSYTISKRNTQTGKNQYANPKNISCERTTLDSVLRTITSNYVQIMNMVYETEIDASTEELFYRSFTEAMKDYGMLSKESYPRYFTNMLEDLLSDIFHQDRIFYLKFTVELLPDAETTLDITLQKPYSHNYSCSEGRKQTHGYDMLTPSNNVLTLTEQQFSISNTKNVEIKSQNFGFDLENNILSVVLDKTKKHYYLDIK